MKLLKDHLIWPSGDRLRRFEDFCKKNTFDPPIDVGAIRNKLAEADEHSHQKSEEIAKQFAAWDLPMDEAPPILDPL